jgi:NAD dependent epimerase/dehydratase family enzyme
MPAPPPSIATHSTGRWTRPPESWAAASPAHRNAGTSPSATLKIALRSAIVFTPDRGGPFALLSRLVRLGLGGANGSGRQFVSWIHDADFVRAVDLLLAGDSSTGVWSGVVNLAAPNPLPNRAFMRILREAWGVPVGLPSARWMIGAAGLLLRTESELVLKSRRVVPGRLLDAGFEFRFSDWLAAARDLVARSRNTERVPATQ